MRGEPFALAPLLDIRGEEGRNSGSRVEGVEARLVGERGGESLVRRVLSGLGSFFFDAVLKMFGRTMRNLVEEE